MDSKIIKLVLFFLLPLNCYAAEFQGSFKQGSFILGKTTPNSKVFIDNREVKVTKDGFFVFGLSRDRKNNVLIKISKNGDTKIIEKKVFKRKYNIQRIDGLPKKKVTPPKEVYERIKQENKLIVDAREIESDLSHFKKKFINPLDKAIVTGVYGSQRILNGKPKRPHYGVDIAAPEGTDILAPTEAIVRMADKDLYYTGGTVMLDHGHGVTSVYSHLSSINVKVGDKINKDQKIGEVGSTGRSTGPHLDWRINWFSERLDPALFIKNK